MNNLLYLFIIFFMIHEFEEIILMNCWMKKKQEYLILKHPILSKYTIKKMKAISTAAFALAVFEEYIILVTITLSAIYFNFYNLWIGVFMAFFFHLIIHILQWLVVRIYIPSIVSSFVCIPFCIYTFKRIIFTTDIDSLVVWTLIGILIVAFNLNLAHKIAKKFDDKIININNKNK